MAFLMTGNLGKGLLGVLTVKILKINGDRIYYKLDSDIREEELLGSHEKIALQGFRDHPSLKKAIVLFNGKQSVHWRSDFQDMGYLSLEIT